MHDLGFVLVIFVGAVVVQRHDWERSMGGLIRLLQRDERVARGDVETLLGCTLS